MMKEENKTNKEIFEQKYPNEKIIRNPLVCAEAIGYLKALIEHCPSEEKWANDVIARMTAMVLYLTL